MTTTPPPSPRSFQERLENVLTALSWHPMTTRDLRKLNPTFRHPFRFRLAQQHGRTYHKSDGLHRVLNRAQEEKLIATAQYGSGGTPIPYYFLTEAGFTFLHPDQDVPKKRSVDTATGTVNTRLSSLFRPISFKMEQHQRAVTESIVHTAVQAHRDGIVLGTCYSRNQLTLKIPIDYARGTALARYIRFHPKSGQPLGDSLQLAPDVFFHLYHGERHWLIFDEIDGGRERIHSEDPDAEAIEKKMRFYIAYARMHRYPMAVRFLTFQRNSKDRLDSLRRCAAELINPDEQGLFLFATLGHYLSENGALTRRRFRDASGQAVAVVPIAPNGSRQRHHLQKRCKRRIHRVSRRIRLVSIPLVKIS